MQDQAAAGNPFYDGPLYFLHIPKTAGTSLRAFLEDHYHADDICRAWLVDEIIERSPSQLGRHRFFAGHLSWYLPGMLPFTPRCITFLRDPVDRSVSHFLHIRNTPGHPWREWCRSATFNEFVADPRGAADLANFQARFLFDDDIQRNHWGYFLNADANPGELLARYTDPSLLEVSRQRLASCLAVGVVERMGESLAVLCDAMGWPAPPELPRYNVTPRQGTGYRPTGAAIERLKELTAFDRVLYADATARLDAALAPLRRPGAAERRFAAAMAARPRVHHITLGFDRPILGWGWLARETLPDGGVARWIGPNRSAVLFLPLADDRDLAVHLNAGAYIEEITDTLRLHVNDQEIPLRWHSVAGDTTARRVFRGVIPRSALQSNADFAKLTLSVSRAVVPATEIPGDTDPRSLAIYVRWLEILPVDPRP